MEGRDRAKLERIKDELKKQVRRHQDNIIDMNTRDILGNIGEEKGTVYGLKLALKIIETEGL